MKMGFKAHVLRPNLLFSTSLNIRDCEVVVVACYNLNEVVDAYWDDEW